MLIHAKTTVPAETFSREKMCKLKAPSHCLVGIPCPDNLPFSDALHKDNVFHNEKGEFCNCWMNRKVDTYWLPKLRDALSRFEVGDSDEHQYPINERQFFHNILISLISGYVLAV